MCYLFLWLFFHLLIKKIYLMRYLFFERQNSISSLIYVFLLLLSAHKQYISCVIFLMCTSKAYLLSYFCFHFFMCTQKLYLTIYLVLWAHENSISCVISVFCFYVHIKNQSHVLSVFIAHKTFISSIVYVPYVVMCT